MTHNNYERREFWNNMKATLEYNLSDPEQKMAHLRAVKSTEMAIVLFDLLHNVKKSIGYKHEDVSEDFMEGVEAVMEYIREVCEDNNINIDELIN